MLDIFSNTPPPRSRASRWRSCLLLMCGALALACETAGAATSVLVITSNDGPLYAEFVASFRQHAQTPEFHDAKINSIIASDQNLAAAAGAADILLAVGVRATEAVIKLGTQQPVLSTLVPRITAETLKDRLNPDAAFSALYLDQPPERQLRLIRSVLPSARRIGVPVGDFSSRLATAFLTAATELGFDLLLTQASADPLAGVMEALPDCDVILALPDARIYNRSTLRAILLSTFRTKTPLFGYSEAFVAAGALAGVYSSPAQIGRQAAELTGQLLAGKSLDAAYYPRYFTVKTNSRIAQVMSIQIADAEKLHALILSGEPQ